MNLKNKATNIIAKAYTFFAVGKVYTQMTLASSLFDGGVAAGNAWADFSTTYRHWFIFILGALALLYYFVKEEKFKGYLQKALIGSVVVFVLTIPGISDWVMATLDHMGGWFASGSGTDTK